MGNIEEAKAKNDIRDVVYALMPERRVSGNATSHIVKYACPFHMGAGPSFVVFGRTQTCKCMSHGCTINGGSTGDVIDFVMQFKSCDMKEALDYLGSPQPEKEDSEFIPNSAKEKKPIVLKMADVTRMHHARKLAIPYFTARGLSIDTILYWKLGASNFFRPKTPYVTRYGEAIWRLSHLRYSLPHTFDNTVFYINMRRDDEDCLQRMKYIDKSVLNPVIEDIEARGNDTPEKRREALLYAFFGDKYMYMPGSQAANRIFGSSLLVNRLPDGLIEYLPSRYVMWSEGQINAMLLGQYTGLPAIADKGSWYLKHLLTNVDELVIVQDVGEAGQMYVNKALAASGRSNGNGARVLNPAAGCNDTGDMAEAGILSEWLQDYGMSMEQV